MRRGPRWSKGGMTPFAIVAGALLVPKRRKPPLPCGRGLGGPEAK